MALIVEDGTGIIYANSYITLEYADNYHSLRQNDTWDDATTVAQEASLVVATEYIEGKYGPRFRGVQATVSGLSFPRVDYSAYYDNNTPILGIPKDLKMATAEYALLELTDSLYPSVVEGGITGTSRKVGSISESVSYSSTGSAAYNIHPQADSYVVGLLRHKRSGRK